MTTGIQPPALHWAPVQSLHWECPCEFCQQNDGSTWTWKGEYQRALNEVTITCIDDDSDIRDITLPPGYAICRLVQEGEKP